MTTLEPLRKEDWGEDVMAFASSLEADGYDFRLGRAGDGRIQGEIIAGPDACEDCLVPKDMMVAIIAKATGAEPSAIELTYPADRHK